jgi:tetratricopeptide (TPR) repeat protein
LDVALDDAEPPGISPHSTWEVGSKVRVKGLVSAAHQNGKIGLLSASNVSKEDRVGVELDGKVLSIRKANLELVMDPQNIEAAQFLPQESSSQTKKKKKKNKKKTKSGNKYGDSGFGSRKGKSSGGVPCVVCDKRDSNTGTRKCAHCNLTTYCSIACQQQHWDTGHKEQCKIWRAKNPASDNTFSDHYHRGLQMSYAHKYEECKKCYREAIKLEPRCLLARGNLAALYRKLGDNDTALQISAEAVNFFTTDPAAKIIGSVVRSYGGSVLIDDEVRALVVTNYGNALKDARRLQEAHDQYSYALEINHPSMMNQALTGIGITSSMLYGGHDARTIAFRRQNVRAFPKSALAMYNLAISLRCKAQRVDPEAYEEAIKVLRKAKKIDRKDADIYAQLGACLMESRMGPDGKIPEEAKQELEAALKLDPHHPGAKRLLMQANGNFSEMNAEMGRVAGGGALDFQQALNMSQMGDFMQNMGGGGGGGMPGGPVECSQQ